MAPKPRRQNPQYQPVVTAIKNVCRDYPPGGGILRELLQNADDAGATSMEFVLDTRSHPTSDLLFEGLAEFQGPALLAFNNSLFMDEDFDSLTRLGNSRKFSDKMTTGKFGRGFSSVFNWTDSPAVLSGSTLLLLDPQVLWSGSVNPPGGPEYDFTQDAHDPKMINQLAAFSRFGSQWHQKFDGTIIRIPLRTPNQAHLSRISSHSTDFQDVHSAMESFSKDLSDGGTLFLRNINSVKFSVDSKLLASIVVTNGEVVKKKKSSLNDALKKISQDQSEAAFDISFQIDIKTTFLEREQSTSFYLHHHVEPLSAETDLASWAASERLFPWVAVAAKLNSNESESYGKLYTVLPLPIHSNQPVHIHGLFSLATDRARLHAPGHNSLHIDLPIRWNQLLFNNYIPKAWVALLEYLSTTLERQNLFYLWPLAPSDKLSLWNDIPSHVVNLVFQKHSKIWYTDVEYVNQLSGLITEEECSSELKQAFCEAKLPVIYLRHTLFSQAGPGFIQRNLSGQNVHNHLRQLRELEGLSESSKLTLLEYLLPRSHITRFHDLNLFPFEDGQFKSIDKGASFLHREVSEKELFRLRLSQNLDITKLSSAALEQLKQAATDEAPSTLRYRNFADLADYLRSVIFPGVVTSAHTINVGKSKQKIIYQAWDWIERTSCRHNSPDTFPIDLMALKDIWILPLTNGNFRKLMPPLGSSIATYVSDDAYKSLFMKIANMDPGNSPQLVDTASLDSKCSYGVTKLLCSWAVWIPDLGLRNGNTCIGLLQWLVDAGTLVEILAPTEKYEILLIARRSCAFPAQQSSIRNALKKLPIFRSVSWKAFNRNKSNDSPSAKITGDIYNDWTTLDEEKTYIGLESLLLLPPIAGHVFLDLTDDLQTVVKDFRLATCLPLTEIIETLAVPSIEKGLYANTPASIWMPFVEILFCNFFKLSPSSQSRLANLKVVPISSKDNGNHHIFGSITEVVDPDAQAINALFFPDEPIHPLPAFLESFSTILKLKGMKQSLDMKLLVNRVRKYSSKKYPVDTVFSRAKKLLLLDISDLDTREQGSLIREMSWLPAISLDGSNTLSQSTGCRDSKDSALIGLVLPTLNFRVHYSWRSALGWLEPLKVEQIIGQLDRGIILNNRTIVGAILSFIAKSDKKPEYLPLLKKRNCVLSSKQTFVSPEQCFEERCAALAPYFFNCDTLFMKENGAILKELGVSMHPTPKDLKVVQEKLEAFTPLVDKVKRDTALKIARILTLYPGPKIQNMKILNEHLAFSNAADLVYNDLGIAVKGNFISAHPGLSRETTDLLGIEHLSERVRKTDLGISDEDDEEFDQREDIADGIRDTLDRYPIRNTFQEYMANADDCEATEVNWLLDEKTYASNLLLTPELEPAQGPSLLVHNDSGTSPLLMDALLLICSIVFTESDFEGLKQVGRGSKRDDPTTIGKFGRGSQTMYHWTDTPKILSGKFLVILDPQQMKLPKSYRTHKRKVGVKILISKLRSNCPDQLAPFIGLWGFSNDTVDYNGTIFRFPLRKRGEQSKLLENIDSPTTADVQSIFGGILKTARISLLFLRNIKLTDFGVRNKPELHWSVEVTSEAEDLNQAFSEVVKILTKKSLPDGTSLCARDTWQRVMEDPDSVPDKLQLRHKRRMKNFECGLAAQISAEFLKEQDKTFTTLQDPEAKLWKDQISFENLFYNCLPLPFATKLGVCIHATFLLSGDRQSIITDDKGKDLGADWNKWILEEAIPKLYLSFLEDLGRRLNHRVFEFFPGKGAANDNLSDFIRKGFWDQVPLSRHRLYPVFESHVQTQEVSATSSIRKLRRPPRLLEYTDALFDLSGIPPFGSLGKLYCQWFSNLVRPPVFLHDALREIDDISLLNSSLLRQKLRSPEASAHLDGVDKSTLKHLLIKIKPRTEIELAELHGCRILPLKDGSLGVLSKYDSSNQYFSVSTELKMLMGKITTRDMFSFSKKLFSDNDISSSFTESILNSKSFNLKPLDYLSVGRLLDCKKEWRKTCDRDHELWLIDFWKFMNEIIRITTQTLTSEKEKLVATKNALASISKFPLYLVHSDGTKSCTRPDDLENIPAIVQPEWKEERNWAGLIIGLLQIDRQTIPDELLKQENKLSSQQSTTRLIKSLSLLSKSRQMAVSTFVSKHLDRENSIILRNHLLASGILRVSSDILNAVSTLPLWPSTLSGNALLPASGALATENSGLLTTWTNKYGLFIESGFYCKNKSNLSLLSVIQLSDETMLKQHIIPFIPEAISNDDISLYRSILGSIHASQDLQKLVSKERKYVSMLKHIRIAARGDRSICLASSLYDHLDQIFVAAFREEASTKFLLDDIQGYLQLFINLGLHVAPSGVYNGNDYIECLQAIQRRPAASDTLQKTSDINLVLAPLRHSDRALSVSQFQSYHWTKISTFEIFPVMDDFSEQPEFRISEMRKIAARHKYLKLSDAVKKDYMPFCWSQVPFIKDEPTPSIFEQLGGNANKPSTAIVWSHLQYLSGLARALPESSLKGFMDDLNATYRFLHDKLTESKATFVSEGLESAKIWWNGEFSEHNGIRDSWLSLDHLLIYSACDAPPLMTLRYFMMPFSNLLQELGCKSIVYPSLTAPRTETPGSLSSLLNALRLQETLTDITLLAKGKSIKAHKIILATQSEYWKREGSGPWKTESKIDFSDEMSFETLSIIVEYVYRHDTFAWTAMHVTDDDINDSTAEKLDMLLDVLAVADRWIMPTLLAAVQHQILLGSKRFIRADNVTYLKKIVKKMNAADLLAYCNEFSIINADAVLLADGSP
ncbi:MAG: hypothetical protein M1829_000199 [Trizodia sp. TS-e1964]|nr:MAG: hypothetical protein M1829_000199 [Trizodia sp. TS-e1964]